MARTVPILFARDIDETSRFYADLGFRVALPDEGYLIVDRDGAQIHFVTTPDLDPSTSNAMCYLHVDDVDGLLAIWRDVDLPESGIPRLTIAEDKPWGMREAALVDPNGTLVRIGAWTG